MSFIGILMARKKGKSKNPNPGLYERYKHNLWTGKEIQRIEKRKANGR